MLTHRKKASSPASLSRLLIEKEKARRSGLWLEGHHYNQKEVEDGCEDDRADDCFCVVTHVVLQFKKDPEPVTLRVTTYASLVTALRFTALSPRLGSSAM